MIISIISMFYKVTYAVTLEEEFLGYTSNKSELQEKINEYMEQGEEDNTAFVDVKTLPEYSLCFVKKETETNDDEIFEKIKGTGETYYQYYAIKDDNEEKFYVATKKEAEKVIDELTEKNSKNKNDLSFEKIYSKELEDFEETDKIVTALYEKPVVYYYSATKVASASEKVDLSKYGISLIKPVTSGYTITSRYGARWGSTHTGLDVAAPHGTTIVAAASGTVTVSVDSGTGYGKYIVISHGNGVQTLYAHCSKLIAKVGEQVAQGQKIAEVGSTGNSTGNHLHLEIRVNGKTLNPQNYLY